MPIYEYQCKSCHHRLEELQKVSDAPLIKCPVCGKPDLERLVSHTSFQLKGGGWYKTDYSTKQPTEKPEGTKESSSEKKETAAETTSTKESTKPGKTKEKSDKTE